MPVEAIEDTATHTIERDDTLEAALFTWTEYVTGEEFRASLIALHEELSARDAEKYLVGTQEITAHADADKRWIAET